VAFEALKEINLLDVYLLQHFMCCKTRSILHFILPVLRYEPSIFIVRFIVEDGYVFAQVLFQVMATDLVFLAKWAPAPEVSGKRLALKPVKLCTKVKCFC
jgi:hypothetical protein